MVRGAGTSVNVLSNNSGRSPSTTAERHPGSVQGGAHEHGTQRCSHTTNSVWQGLMAVQRTALSTPWTQRDTRGLGVQAARCSRKACINQPHTQSGSHQPTFASVGPMFAISAVPANGSTVAWYSTPLRSTLKQPSAAAHRTGGDRACSPTFQCRSTQRRYIQPRQDYWRTLAVQANSSCSGGWPGAATHKPNACSACCAHRYLASHSQIPGCRRGQGPQHRR